MNEENEQKIVEKVIQFFTDELGYPRENILADVPVKYIHGNVNVVSDLIVYVFGKPKIIIEIKGYANSAFGNPFQFKSKFDVDSILYYLTTDGDSYSCYSLLDEKKSESAPNYEDLTTQIYQEHDEIYRFLEEKREIQELLTYKIRATNNNNRLGKGLWFLGNENYLALSFWAGNDWKNKTPNIYLQFLPNGKVSLIFSSRDSSIKGDFLKNLATILPGFNQGKSKGELINYWEKNLSNAVTKPFLETLEEFLKTDKKIIDTFLTNEIELKRRGLDGLGFIEISEFNKNLDRLKNYRSNLDTFAQRAGRFNRFGENNKDFSLFITSLTLNNIGNFREIALDLNKRIICILGENGVGKSTILRAILLGLIGVNETSEVDINKIQQLLRITGERNGLPIFAPQGNITLDYEYGKPYRNKINFDKFEDKLEVQIEDDLEIEMDSFGATQGDYLNNLVIGFSQIQSRQNNKTGLPSDLIKKAHVKDILPLLYDEEDSRFQELSDWIIKLHAESLNNIEKESERKIIDFVFDVVGEVIGEKVIFEKVNHLDNLLWVKTNGNDAIPFHLISQGFKNVFAWIGHFMKRLAEVSNYAADFMNTPAILLIDEIDTYLHPKWQKNILDVLANKFENTQIIVTTHSPLVASHLSVASKAVYIIKEEEIVAVPHIYGKEIANIFDSWMDVKKRPPAIQLQINDLFEALETEDMEVAKKLYEDLKETLGVHDGDLVEAKAFMNLIEN